MVEHIIRPPDGKHDSRELRVVTQALVEQAAGRVMRSVDVQPFNPLIITLGILLHPLGCAHYQPRSP